MREETVTTFPRKVLLHQKPEALEVHAGWAWPCVNAPAIAPAKPTVPDVFKRGTPPWKEAHGEAGRVYHRPSHGVTDCFAWRLDVTCHDQAHAGYDPVCHQLYLKGMLMCILLQN